MSSIETLPSSLTFEEAHVGFVARTGRAVIHFANKYLSVVPEAPDYQSEHFDHAEKWNDPRPALNDYRG